MALRFVDVFREEISAVSFRREAVRSGALARMRAPPAPDADGKTPAVRTDEPLPAADAAGDARTGAAHHLRVERSEIVVPRRSASPDPSDGSERLGDVKDLTGIALSGGGMRSASFCLGVLQGLDALSEDHDPRVLDAVDYLSTVSGGGYIGTCMVAGLHQPDHSFPFRSRFDEEETPETQHLRDFSNFLVPRGAIDYAASAVLVVRGLLVNALIVLPTLLLLAVATVAWTPLEENLKAPSHLYLGEADLLAPFGSFALTISAAVILAVVLFISALFTSWNYVRGSLRDRERLGYTLAAALAIPFLLAIFEFQPFILKALFATTPATSPPASDASGFTGFVGSIVPKLAAVLTPAAVALIAVAQRLANVAKATVGESSWSSFLKKHSSRIAIYLAAIVAPVLLWVAYIYLAFWGVRVSQDALNPDTPAWLAAVAGWLETAGLTVPRTGPVATAYAILALMLAAVCLFIGPNANSLHRLYRDRLSRAFLFARPGYTAKVPPDALRFSELKFRNGETWHPTAACSPFPIVNTAINLEASPSLNKRGRNADTFTFSPLHVGSRATGYVGTTEMEARVKDLSLAMAMATSGAAASANMGSSTVKVLTFSLSLLNIRLGYWLGNPARIGDFGGWITRMWANVGSWYFSKESLGLLNEKALNVYLTDGGHVENLGVYELLKRRCKVVLAVDAEGDQDMTFPSLMNLQVMARIDLGVRIDLPWHELRSRALEVTPASIGAQAAAAGRRGPHAAIGRIYYDDAQTGVLIYLKSSLSGDEPDYVLDYKRRNATFPHETTADQFFTEEQFEAYRALGFHAAHGLLSGNDPFACASASILGWPDEVGAALALLNVPPEMADRVVARIP